MLLHILLIAAVIGGIFLWYNLLFTKEGREDLSKGFSILFKLIGFLIALFFVSLILKVLFHIVLWAIAL